MQLTWYSPKTLSDLWQIPRTTVWEMIRRGDFKDVMKVGKHYRISHEARLDFEKRHKQTK